MMPSPPPTPPPHVEPVVNQNLPFLGMIYFTVLGLFESILPYTGTWAPTLQLLSYLVKVAPVLGFFYQASPTPPSSQTQSSNWGPDINEVCV